MRTTVLLASILVATAHISWPAEKPASRFTLVEARRIIREQGARGAVETSLDDKWSELLDAIATGETAWLDIAIQLGLGRPSDAEAADTLSAAMGEALRRAPREVLRRLDGKPFQPEDVCGNSFADLDIQGATDVRASITAQELAVAKVPDAKLRQRRDLCLKLIRDRKR